MPSLNVPPSFFPWLYMLTMVPYGMEYTSGQLGSAVAALFPSSFLSAPSPTGWDGVKSREGLDSV